MEFLLGIVFAGLSLIVVPLAGDPNQPIRALVAGAALIGVGVLLRDRDIPTGLRRATYLLGALVVLYSVAALFGGAGSALFGVHGRFQGLVSGAVYIGAGLTGATIFRKRIFAVVWPLAVAASIQSLVVLGQRAAGALPSGTMGNQVLAGGWLAVCASTLVAASLVSSGRNRWLLGGAAVLATLGTGACGSRGAWLGLVIALITLVFMLQSRRASMVLAGTTLALALGIAVFGGGAAVAKLDPGALATGSSAARWQIWRGSAQMIAANPFVGVGPGRFLYEFPRFEPFERAVVEPGDVRADQAHSESLQVASEAGLPAVLLLVTLFGLALLQGTRAARSKDGVALIAVAGLWAAVAQGIFGITTVETGAIAWLLGGIALSRWASLPADSARGPAAGGKADLPRRADVRFGLRLLLIALGLFVFLTAGAYVVADSAYRRGLSAFERGDFTTAVTAHRVAQRILPMVDTYRVAEADAAAYLGGEALARSLVSLEAGLAIEPDSYDLSLARARALRALAATPAEIADAYVRCVELYPLGVEVRVEAVKMLYAADREAEAAEMELDVVRLQEAVGKDISP